MYDLRTLEDILELLGLQPDFGNWYVAYEKLISIIYGLSNIGIITKEQAAYIIDDLDDLDSME